VLVGILFVIDLGDNLIYFREHYASRISYKKNHYLLILVIVKKDQIKEPKNQLEEFYG